MSIIGITGKAGSGKDTAGSLIQYLFWKNRVESGSSTSITMPLRYFLDGSNMNDILSKWTRKKFADKLKDVLCILTGCTRYQLEQRDFKNSLLPPEWWIVDETVIKNWLLNMYSREEIDTDPEIFDRNWKNSPVGIVKYTYRDALQLIGTDIFRNHFHINTWVNATMVDYSEDKNWIITDVRFPNELVAIRQRKGLIIRITCDREADNLLNTDHASETALDGYKIDYTVENNGTIEELLAKLEEILIKEKLIQ